MSSEIIVRFTYAGMHRWKDAPDNRAYLRDPHRHLFHVEVSTWVDHDEREIEFHDLCDAAKENFADCCLGVLEFERGSPVLARYLDRSCETMARLLASTLSKLYSRRFDVSVFEDGEFGAKVSVNDSEQAAA